MNLTKLLACGLFLTGFIAMLHAQEAQKPQEVQKSLLSNGQFAEVNPDGLPKHWTFGSKPSLVKGEKGNVLELRNNTCTQYLLAPELAQSSTARKIKVTFTVSGSQWLDVCFNRYSDTKDPKAPNGYRRKFFPQVKAKRIFLKSEETKQSVEYTIAPDEWAGLSFAAPDAKLSDIAVTLEK